MPASTAFISYHHADRVVGETLWEQLTFLASCGDGKTSLSCFLDAKDIPPATQWQPVIDQNLGNKDWLIVVYTGDQSVYCGYEIGTFWQLHATSPHKRIMGLYDVSDDRLPVILRNNQNTPVPNIDKVVEADKVAVSADEASFWYRGPVGKFLLEFCSYQNLYLPAHETADPNVYTNNIALAAKRIANAFALARGTDVESETPTQISFELTVSGVGDASSRRFPARRPS
jgi:hypothetical protein